MADPEIYARAVVAVLTSYPENIVSAVCDPRGGLPAKSKFLPTVYEIREACERRMSPILDDARRQRIRAENDADRPAPVSPEDAERRRRFAADWRRGMAAILEGHAQ